MLELPVVLIPGTVVKQYIVRGTRTVTIVELGENSMTYDTHELDAKSMTESSIIIKIHHAVGDVCVGESTFGTVFEDIPIARVQAIC